MSKSSRSVSTSAKHRLFFFSFSLLPRICVGGCAVFVHMMALEHQRKTEPRSEINEGKRKAVSRARARAHTIHTSDRARTHTHTTHTDRRLISTSLSLVCLSSSAPTGCIGGSAVTGGVNTRSREESSSARSDRGQPAELAPTSLRKLPAERRGSGSANGACVLLALRAPPRPSPPPLRGT